MKGFKTFIKSSKSIEDKTSTLEYSTGALLPPENVLRWFCYA